MNTSKPMLSFDRLGWPRPFLPPGLILAIGLTMATSLRLIETTVVLYSSTP
jgi:hypothetical protein